MLRITLLVAVFTALFASSACKKSEVKDATNDLKEVTKAAGTAAKEKAAEIKAREASGVELAPAPSSAVVPASP